ncbi:MAG: hypothetical protein H6838_20270 [Planctomycetes bacterium]|nr:hypothetical protein [Planctomycetota bacterium]
MVARPPSTSLWFLLTALIGGCASGPDIASGPRLEPGRRTTVRFVQFTTGQAFSLQNASSGSADEIYSDKRADRLTKVVSDGEVQALVDILAEHGMFTYGAAAAPSDAREALVVEFPGKRWVWTRPRLPGDAVEAAFQDARGYFLALYNMSVAYHSMPGDEVPDLAGQRERIQRDAAAAREKLLRLGRQQ